MEAIIVEVRRGKNESTKIPEIKELAESIGYKIVNSVVQVRRNPDSSYLIGEGKLREIKKIIRDKNIKTVIFSNTLKASQTFRIRRELGWDVDVIDRNILILKVFEERSKTFESKMQIELARLYYVLPWIKEYLKFRNVYGEQVGQGALGEYLHKIYKQHVIRRINLLEEKLRNIRHKNIDMINRRKQRGFPEVILTGYTQAGKTELFNKLTFESKPVGIGPFTTLSTYARRMRMTADKDVIIIDSIGFIEDLHPIILNAFYTTLHELSLSDLILLVVDGSEEKREIMRKIRTSQEIISKVAPGTELIIALNKIDLINYEKIEEDIKIIRGFFPFTEIVPISAKKGENLDVLIKKIIEKVCG